MTDCIICTENVTETAQKCGHTFHLNCLQKQFKPECPLCRTALDIKVTGTIPDDNIPLPSLEDEELTNLLISRIVQNEYNTYNIDDMYNTYNVDNVDNVDDVDDDKFDYQSHLLDSGIPPEFVQLLQNFNYNIMLEYSKYIKAPYDYLISFTLKHNLSYDQTRLIDRIITIYENNILDEK